MEDHWNFATLKLDIKFLLGLKPDDDHSSTARQSVNHLLFDIIIYSHFSLEKTCTSR